MVATEDETTITLQAGGVRAVFDKTTGTLVEFGAKTNLIVAGPRLNVWRAATDNDGIKLMLDRAEWQTYKPLVHWLALGLDKLTNVLESIRLERVGRLAGRRDRPSRVGPRAMG